MERPKTTPSDTAGPVLVTGIAGFIGAHVSAALRARGQDVVGIDNFDPFYGRDLKLANLAAAGPGVQLLEGDLTGPALDEAVARWRPSGIIHLAAKAGVRPSIADPAGYMHANVVGTARVLQAASRFGCSRVVIASSSSVYGNAARVPFHEDADVSQPISPYAASKRACELAAFTHHHLTGLPIACLRFFTVYGPRQRPDLAIGMFLRRIAAGQPIQVFGDGSTSRDYTYIDDIVAGVLAAYDRVPGFGWRIWNLGNHRPTALRDLIATIETTVGRPALIDRRPPQPGDVERTCADTTRAREELGFQARTVLADGVERQWRAMRDDVLEGVGASSGAGSVRVGS